MDEWTKKIYIDTQWNTIGHKKEGNPIIYYNMDGPWEHYAKWIKSDRKRQIPYDLTYVWNLKKTKS